MYYDDMVFAATGHLYRTADAALQTGARRLSAKDLMTEGERILHKTGSGLTLFKRLQKDHQLRLELFNILTEMDADEGQDATMEPE